VASKKFVSFVYPGGDGLLMLAFVTNFLPAACFVRGSNGWNHWVPHLSGLVTGYGAVAGRLWPPFLQ